MTEYNSFANPKVETKRFKIYAKVGGTDALPTWELQGRGVESWTVETNSSVNATSDVLGYVDYDREPSQPTQSGVTMALRKDSVLSTILFDAFYTNDMSKLNSIPILQKFEMVDGETTGNCIARLDKECMIGINSFSGEAGGNLSFEVDIHYSNNFVFGEMSKVDADPIVFTPNDDDDE